MRTVEIVHAVEDAIGDQEALAVVDEVRGEFRTHVALFPRGDVETVKAVARALGTHALAPDDESPNPYAMLLIRYDGAIERVCLQADALERGEYQLG